MLDTTADASGNAGAAMNLPQMGNMSIECQLQKALDYSITVLCFAEQDCVLEIDSARQAHICFQKML
ncbi:Homogentisate 1,2-dioxygenase [Frankliniella fusca]|uniref:Homogentisate 1,2-dioxygenase n=1 Tax=Frankliniella fusca TaxID=407009 RepID=A0AAE1LPF7_9NEOP|nr:Homogentisate 1,2-dioxygenase [Frankliniella fusca]